MTPFKITRSHSVGRISSDTVNEFINSFQDLASKHSLSANALTCLLLSTSMRILEAAGFSAVEIRDALLRYHGEQYRTPMETQS